MQVASSKPLDFAFRVNPIQVKTYEKSLEKLREQYNFDIIPDESIKPATFRLEDYSEDKRFYRMFGVVDPENSLKNYDTCMSPKVFLDGNCGKSACSFWFRCEFNLKKR